MEYIPAENVGPPRNLILCCECGVQIEPNPANMCVACLRSQVDITQAIPKQVTLQFCKGCERYLNPPAEWIHCPLESKELLSLCLKKLKGLNTVKLIDASFVWTEPHSKRIKIKLTVQAEVNGGAILQQIFIVEYTVSHQMCGECHRYEAQDFWRSVVQIRQKAENKKTFFYLEQLILKHKAHETALGIKPNSGGLDFFFATDEAAMKMVNFLTGMLPCVYTKSKKLMSHDTHSNVYNYKMSYSVSIIPVSKDNAVCLPKALTQKLGGISPICLVYKMTRAAHLIDPCSAQIAEVSCNLFNMYPFHVISNPGQLVQYVVMDIEPIMDKDRKCFPGQGSISNRHVLADVWVVKASELGINDNTIHTRTHLGHVLKLGDYVLGYNLENSNINSSLYEALDKSKVPDVILVKKYYDRTERRKRRMWKLKHIAEEDTGMVVDTKEYDDFLDDLEEDPELRQNVNIFRDKNKIIPVDAADEPEDGIPRITLAEMLDDLVIEDAEMAE